MSSEFPDPIEVVPFLAQYSAVGSDHLFETRSSVNQGSCPQDVGLQESNGGTTRVPVDAEGTSCMGPLKARQHAMLISGREVIDLSMVNPDLAPPRAVLDRLLEYVTKTSTHRYAVSRGVRRLREAFAEKYTNSFKVELDPESEICVCLGSKDAMYHALRALVRTDDTVVMSAPTYPAHLSAAHLVGAKPELWRAPEDSKEAAHSLGQLLSATNARLVILNFPCNPTGRVVTREWLHAIVETAQQHKAFVVNDFVYGEMCFDGKKAPSLLGCGIESKSGRFHGLLEVYSLSKAYNVPGWRVGALSGDSRVVKEVARQKSVADYGLFLPLQYAASVALTSKEDLVRSTITQYDRRLKILRKGLVGLGWRVTDPSAGASVWAKFPEELLRAARARKMSGSREGANSVAVAELLLEEAGVLCTPGIVFGTQFDDHLRFAAVVPEERMRDVVTALGMLS